MRVLWVGDAYVSTGFARCTHAVCDELHARGHDVHVLGMSYYGEPHTYDYPLYPPFAPFNHGKNFYGTDRLPYLVEQLRPDTIVILNDPWNVRGYFAGLDRHSWPDGYKLPPVVGWLAADGDNQSDGIYCSRLSHVVTWTDYAAEQLRHGGYIGPASVVPLGVDHHVFRPIDESVARSAACGGVYDRSSDSTTDKYNTPDLFMVGVVGRNQLRKRIDLSIRYFARWVHSFNRDNAYLYLHIAPTTEGGVDIRRLCSYYDINGRVLLREPQPGKGASDDFMPYMYSSFDVLLSTTQGEGWGLPALEAMACGVPVIVPRWSAYGEWVPPSMTVECTATTVNGPMVGGSAYTIGGIMDEEQAILALERAYSDVEWMRSNRQLAIETAAKYSWHRTSTEMADLLEEIVLERMESTTGAAAVVTAQS